MKKILCILFFSCEIAANAQVFTGSAKDKSSIIYQGTTLGINITDPSINFSLNNLGNEKYKNRSRKFVWAVNSTASRNEGTANLLEGSTISSGIDVNACVGLSWIYGNAVKMQKLNESQNLLKTDFEVYITNTNILQKQLEKTDTLLRQIKTAEITEYLPDIKDSQKRKMLNDSFDHFIDNITVSDANDGIKELIINNPEDSVFIKKAAIKITSVALRAYVNTNEYQSKNDQLWKKIMESRGYWRKRFTVYMSGGYSTSSFKWYNNLDNSNYINSFKDKLFSGYNIKIGANLNVGTRWLFGINGGYERVNNFSTLSSKDFTIRSTLTNANGQELTSEKKVTAYSGSYYDDINTIPLNADIIYFFPVSDTTTCAANLYLRHTYSENAEKLPQTTNIGIGIYLFKNNASKFLGGIYFEVPDIGNNIAKNDPDATLKPLNKRLIFGFVAKFTFASIFSYCI